MNTSIYSVTTSIHRLQVIRSVFKCCVWDVTCIGCLECVL